MIYASWGISTVVVLKRTVWLVGTGWEGPTRRTSLFRTSISEHSK